MNLKEWIIKLDNFLFENDEEIFDKLIFAGFQKVQENMIFIIHQEILK